MLKRLLVVATVTCAVCVLSTVAARAADDPAIGKRLDGFSLRDFHGNVHTLAQHGQAKAVVLAVLGTECPLARLYAPRLSELAREYRDKPVVFLGVDANWHDTPTKLATFAQSYKIEFPLLVDAGNALADRLGATRTPEVFLLDAMGVVRYHGRVDDQYAVGVQRDKPLKRDLATALDELLGGKEVSQPSTAPSGCLIARVNKTEPRGETTYSQHVAAIFNRRCVECHREGELAPFPLTSYRDVLAWSAMIREVVSENRMPPWLASGEFGKFSNDCSLTTDEKQTIFAWIDNGCPEGNAADLPQPPKFTSGWRMGKPDLVFRMPAAFTVPAEGTVDYQYFMVDPDLKEDIWVRVAEARPGNVAVVHHVVLFAVPPSRKISEDHLEDAQINGQMISVYAPGMNPWKYPDGSAMKIAAGSQLVLQTHYTPNGTVQDDASYVGLKLCDASEVKREVRYNLVANANFEIPPGAPNHEVRQAVRILKDIRLLNLFPHMHYRGKSFRFEAEYPDGGKEVLLDVPRYDFTWQLRYDLAEPKLLPKGTRLICIAHYDNSENNPLNPDPKQTVRFGLQSWEEMLVGYYTSVAATAEELAAKGK
jgi:peroxiredoxin